MVSWACDFGEKQLNLSSQFSELCIFAHDVNKKIWIPCHLQKIPLHTQNCVAYWLNVRLCRDKCSTRWLTNRMPWCLFPVQTVSETKGSNFSICTRVGIHDTVHSKVSKFLGWQEAHTSSLDILAIWTSAGWQDQSPPKLCSDITNTLVGISGETGPVARISMFIVCTVLPPVGQWFCFRSWCVTPHSSPTRGGAGLSQLIIF